MLVLVKPRRVLSAAGCCVLCCSGNKNWVLALIIQIEALPAAAAVLGVAARSVLCYAVGTKVGCC